MPAKPKPHGAIKRLPDSDAIVTMAPKKPRQQYLPESELPESDLPESELPESELPEGGIPESQESRMPTSPLADVRGHKWRPYLAGHRVPSSLADSSYRPEMGDAISYSGDLSQGYIQRQRNQQLLNMPKTIAAKQLPEQTEDDMPVSIDANRSVTPSRTTGVFRIPDVPGVRAKSNPHSSRSTASVGSSRRAVERELGGAVDLQHSEGEEEVVPRRPNAVGKGNFALPSEVTEESERFIPRRQFAEGPAGYHRLPVDGESKRSRRVGERSGVVGDHRREVEGHWNAGRGGSIDLSSGAHHNALRNSSFDSLYDMTPDWTKRRQNPLPVPSTPGPRHVPSSPPLPTNRGGSPLQSSGLVVDLEEEGIQTFDAKMTGRMRYDYALRYGCLAAVALARTHAIQLGHSLADEIKEAKWRQTGRKVLWSMPKDLLDTLISGNIAAEAASATSSLGELFSTESDWSRQALQQAPVLYSISIPGTGTGRAKGTSPPSREWRVVIQTLRRYVSLEQASFKEVLDIDNAFRRRSEPNDVAEGKHFYLSNEREGVRRRVRGRIETVRQFCDALEARLNGMPASDEDTPLNRPPQYIGYAFFFPGRWKNHMRGETAFLLHLVHAILQFQFPGMYALDAFPLCFLAQDDEARLGELLLTLLADSFSSTGGGFNAHPPGLNNTSADTGNWSKQETDRFWAGCRELRIEMDYWEEARIAEMAILEQGGMQASEGGSEAYLDATQQVKLMTLREERVRLEGRLAALRKSRHDLVEKNVKEVEEALEGEALQGPRAAEARRWVRQALASAQIGGSARSGSIDAMELARRKSLEDSWFACTTTMSELKERVELSWDSEDGAGIEAGCDELSMCTVQLLQLTDSLDGHGDLDEQDSARLFDEPEQGSALGNWCETRGCEGRCAGASASGTCPADDEVDEWTRLWSTMRAAEGAVRGAWEKSIGKLAKRCHVLRKVCRKLLRMLLVVRAGREPLPADFEFDF